ncbi:MAG: hypothetical protein COA99_14995 [Moraxellaceae bacterium]|nr:MAG: hypothetical protein COA99_14995 [Moraxellaceae bacterium]
MSGFAEYLRRPVRILGEDVVFIPDIVGPVPLSEQHQYVELAPATNTCPAIHIRETDIEEIRESYPNTRVFGMWHTLINSGLVSYRKALQVVTLSPQDGYYIHCDLGRAEFSGDYEAGFFAADANFNLDEAAELDPDVDQLALPETEAQLASELLAKRKETVRSSWSHLLSVVMLVVFSFVGVDFLLDEVFSLESAELENKTELLQVIQSGLDKLKTTRLTEVPNDSKMIEAIADVWNTHLGMVTQSNQSFQQEELSFVVPDTGINPAEQFSSVSSEYNPKGEWTIKIKVNANEY